MRAKKMQLFQSQFLLGSGYETEKHMCESSATIGNKISLVINQAKP